MSKRKRRGQGMAMVTVEERPGILHAYGQPTWHDELLVIGDEKGLRSLRAAIDAALESGAGVREVMQNDGEGYAIEVVRASDEDARSLYPAYTEEFARGPVPGDWPKGVRKALDALIAASAGGRR